MWAMRLLSTPEQLTEWRCIARFMRLGIVVVEEAIQMTAGAAGVSLEGARTVPLLSTAWGAYGLGTHGVYGSTTH